MTLSHDSPRIISTHLNVVSFSLFLSHLYMALFLLITPRHFPFRSFSTAFPRRVLYHLLLPLSYGDFILHSLSAEDFHGLFRFQPVFLKYFPGFPSDDRILTRFSWGFPGIFLYPRLFRGEDYQLPLFMGFIGVFLTISTHWINLPYLSEAYPRRASNYRISSISHHFFIRSMSAEGISIKCMVKITQSCSIFNSPRYSPLISKTYYNNPVFFLSEAYPRRI